jgi:ribosomal protein L37AE/L43A
VKQIGGEWVTAKCPTCRAEAIEVRVGGRGAPHAVRCSKCGNRFIGSAWVERSVGARDEVRVDLVERVRSGGGQ